MKGYLSRIAKQSGLRFSEPGFEARTLTAGRRIKDPITPDIEQTVMVGPNVPEARVSMVLESKSPPGMQPRPKPERAEAPALSRQVRTREDATQAPTQREARDHSAGRQAAPAGIENSYNLTRSLPQDDLREDRVAGAPRVAEQTAFKDSGPSERAREQTRRDKLAEGAGPEARASDVVAEHVTESQEYFARTAEILGKGEAVTPEMQTIVLQEVREWVAASPVELPVAEDVPQKRDTGRVAKVASPRAPGVVTIRERGQPGGPDPAQPIEQKFDLSIGTINVTIEEAEKPRLPEPQTRHPGKAAPDDDSRFSRLSRSYI